MVVFDKQKYVYIKKKSNVFCYLYSLFKVNIIIEQELRLRIIISSKGKTIKINNVKTRNPPETSGGYLQAKEKSSSESHGRSGFSYLIKIVSKTLFKKKTFNTCTKANDLCFKEAFILSWCLY